MDFLNQATAQVRELMLSMTPGARVTAFLLLGVIGVSLGYLVQHHSAGPDDFLFNGEFLPATDVDRAEAAIAQAGLNGYERVGNRLKVPRGQKSAYLAAVADGDALPPNFHKIVEDALDISPFASGDTRREKLKAGREQQLSMLIRAMDGIEDAHVLFDVRRPEGLAREGQATATVSVRPAPGEAIDASRTKMIRKAVAGAIAGLDPDQVTVTNLSDGSMLGGNDEITPESFDEPYFKVSLAFERSMQAKIEQLLYDIPGVRVRVTAELDDTIEQTTSSTKPRGEVAPFRTVSDGEESETSDVLNGGRPGLTAQGPNRNRDEAPEKIVKKKTKVTSDQSENFIFVQEEIRRTAPLIPKNVRAAIAIPSDYLISVWRERQRKKGEDPNGPLPTDIDTTLTNIKNEVVLDIEGAVVPLLPKELAKNEFSAVKVTFFTSLTPDPVEPPSVADQALSWAGQNFNTMTMAVVALVSLMMLRSMVKAIPPADPAPTLEAPTLPMDLVGSNDQSAATPGEPGATEEGDRPRLKLKKGNSLKDELTDIVREDPDAAASILRNWIGNAG